MNPQVLVPSQNSLMAPKNKSHGCCFSVQCYLHHLAQDPITLWLLCLATAHRGAPGLALWQPGMTSWYLCRSARIDSFSGDLAFYQGKLYVVRKSRPRIFAFFSLGRTSTVSVCPVLSIIRLIGLSLPRPLIQRGATWWYGVKNCY